MTQPDPSVSSESVSDLSPHPLSFPTSQALVEPEDQTEASKSKGSKAWRENRALFLGVGATAVVLGGSLAAYVSQRYSGPSPQAAIGLVPQSAIAAVQLSGDRSQWAIPASDRHSVAANGSGSVACHRARSHRQSRVR
ncbi:MAG: hypothetical protein HC857_03430 [Synechococcales cyanobacterium RU_4_20]|nr:hypothetical protein [Synechococcales cyanobacterium RU_4_20]